MIYELRFSIKFFTFVIFLPFTSADTCNILSRISPQLHNFKRQKKYFSISQTARNSISLNLWRLSERHNNDKFSESLYVHLIKSFDTFAFGNFSIIFPLSDEICINMITFLTDFAGNSQLFGLKVAGVKNLWMFARIFLFDFLNWPLWQAAKCYFVGGFDYKAGILISQTHNFLRF